MEEDPEKKKKQLLNTVQATKKEAEEYVSKGRNIVEDGQYMHPPDRSNQERGHHL